MTRNKLYGLVLLLATAGYFWLFYNYRHDNCSTITLCLFKRVTGIPCPACGTTDSITLILHGNWVGAYHTNPLGFLMLFVIIVFPIWIITDLFRKHNSFLLFFNLTETYIKKWWIAVPAIILILFLWITNIYKTI
jgi:hypothetical protein